MACHDMLSFWAMPDWVRLSRECIADEPRQVFPGRVAFACLAHTPVAGTLAAIAIIVLPFHIQYLGWARCDADFKSSVTPSLAIRWVHLDSKTQFCTQWLLDDCESIFPTRSCAICFVLELCPCALCDELDASGFPRFMEAENVVRTQGGHRLKLYRFLIKMALVKMALNICKRVRIESNKT